MGYHIQVILTDWEKVARLYGSKDHSLLNIVKEELYEEFDDFLYGVFDMDTGELSAKQLMLNCINGDTTNEYKHLICGPDKEKFAQESLGAVYRYLHIEICLHFGYEINRNKDGWPMLPAYMHTFEERYRSFFKIPYSAEFPQLFCVLDDELDTYYPMWQERLKEAYPTENYLQKDLDFIFEEARKTGLSILLANH